MTHGHRTYGTCISSFNRNLSDDFPEARKQPYVLGSHGCDFWSGSHTVCFSVKET